MNPRVILIIAAAVATIGCSSTPGGDAAISPQHRTEYERLKYADPSTGRIPANVRNMERAFAKTMPGAYEHGKPHERLQDEEWSSRGPWNVGGRTRAFLLDSRNPAVLLAAGISGGLWRSSNDGVTWSKITPPDQLHAISCIAQDPRPERATDLFYGTGEIYGNSARIAGDGIWKSSDGGLTWKVLTSTESSSTPASGPFAYTWRIVVQPTSTGRALLVASALNGIMRSTDDGQTWSNVLGSTSLFCDVARTSNGVLYATFSAATAQTGQQASRRGVFRSTDNGVTWQDISPSFLPTNVRRIVLGIAPSDPSQIYAIAETPGTGKLGRFILRDGERQEWHSLWKYRDGQGWDDRSASLPRFGGRNGDFFSQGGYDLICHVSPFDTNLVVIGGTNLYRSENGFADTTTTAWIGGYGKAPTPTERYPSYPEHHPDQHWFVYHPMDERKAYSINDGGVQVTMNVRASEVAWRSVNNGYLTTQFYAVAINDSAGDQRVIGGMQDNGTWMSSTIDGSTPWDRRGGGDGAFCAILRTRPELITSTQQGRVRRVILDQNGAQSSVTRIDPIGASDYLFINPFSVDHNDERVLYVAGGRMMWRNADITAIPLGGDDSTSVNWDSLPQTRIPSGQISAVAVSRVPAHIVWYGTTNGRVFKLLNANTGMPTPIRVDSLLPKGAMINSIAIDPRDADHVLLCYSNYNIQSVFRTTDGGATWSNVSGNLEGEGGAGPAVNWVSIMPREIGALYVVGTSIGVFYTGALDDASTTWAYAAADVVGNVPVDMVLTRASDSIIVVGTHGTGVYSGRLQLPPAPTAPTLVSPINGASSIRPESTSLQWNVVPGATYRVQIARDPGFDTIVRQLEALKDPRVAMGNLPVDLITYYWRVYAIGPGGRSRASETWSFTTVVGEPQLLQPASSARDVPSPPVRLRWSMVNGATTYEYQVGTTILLSTVTRSAMVNDTTAMVEGLEQGKRYFWRVRALRDTARGEWTVARNFTTSAIADVQEEASSSLIITPNPAVDRIDVVTPDGVGVVEIIDAKGRVVASREVTSPRTRIDVKQLAAGTYTVRSVIAGTVHTMPLVIVR